MSHDHRRQASEKTTRPRSGNRPEPAAPASIDPRVGHILNLQALVGNQAVQRLIKPIAHVPTLRTGTPDISREDENTDAAASHFEAGQRLFRTGNYDAAAVRLERARQIPGLPDDAYTTLLFDLGICNLRLERFATAVTYFEQYLERPGADRGEVEPLLEQAQQGTAADAETIMNREGGTLPPPSSDPTAQTDTARTLFQQADALYQAGQYRQSIIIFEQVREMEITEGGDEIHMACVYNIGRANFELGRFATAIIYLEQYIDNAPSETDRREAEALLAQAQEQAGALTSTEQGAMMFRMADEAYQAGEYASALQRFKTLLEIRGLDDDTRSQIEYNVGMCYFRLGRMADARTHLEAYIASHPGDSEAQAQLDQIVQQAQAE